MDITSKGTRLRPGNALDEIVNLNMEPFFKWNNYLSTWSFVLIASIAAPLWFALPLIWFAITFK